MDFLDKTLRDYTRQLASRAAVPGGGSAAALAAALGTALAGMVGELTVGKPRYAAVEAEVRELMEQAGELRERLLACVERDAEAFEPLSRAYAIPRDDPARPEVLEEALRSAAAVPLEILKLCCRGIELHRALADKGSTLALSDVGSGVVLCWGAMYAAAMNVRANTHLMQDKDYAAALNARCDELMGQYWEIADGVYEEIYGRLAVTE